MEMDKFTQQMTDSTLAMLGPEREGINIEKHYGKIPAVECCASQINQVFIHIIRNAIESLKRPRLSCTDSDTQLDTLTLKIATQLTADNRIATWIEDNGLGIPTEIQDRIFDPFFTTKDVGQGTGLGLSISYQIVAAQHKGQLKSYSVPGKGAKFLIELPISLPLSHTEFSPSIIAPPLSLMAQTAVV